MVLFFAVAVRSDELIGARPIDAGDFLTELLLHQLMSGSFAWHALDDELFFNTPVFELDEEDAALFVTPAVHLLALKSHQDLSSSGDAFAKVAVGLKKELACLLVLDLARVDELLERGSICPNDVDPSLELAARTGQTRDHEIGRALGASYGELTQDFARMEGCLKGRGGRGTFGGIEDDLSILDALSTNTGPGRGRRGSRGCFCVND